MSLPAYITTHKGDAARSTFWCVELAFPVVQRFTDCPFPLTISGNVYTPAVLFVEGVQSSESDPVATSAALTFGSGEGNAWQLLLAALTSAQRHPVVSITEAWADPSGVTGAVQSSRLMLTGRLESAEWDDTQARLTLGPVADPTMSRLPFREYSEKCSIRKFKGLQCKYAGAATSCDRSYATCTSYGNQANFGGFRWLPADSVSVLWTYYTSDYVQHDTEITLKKRQG